MKTIAAFALGAGDCSRCRGWPPRAGQEGRRPEAGGQVHTREREDERQRRGRGREEGRPTPSPPTRSPSRARDFKFVMGYKIDPKTDPMKLDMEILEGPEGKG